MKAALIILLVTLCGVCLVSCAPKTYISLPSLPTGVTTTTAKPWTQKFKDGLSKFFQGAAVASAVQQGFQNARGHKKKHQPSIDIKPKH